MIVREIDWVSPLDAFTPLAGEPYAMLLHAGERAVLPGWSVIAACPTETIETGGFPALRSRAAARKSDEFPWPYDGAPPPVTAGLVGFAGYELGASVEPSATGPASPFAFPEMAFGVYDAVAAFDRTRARAYICGHTKEAVGRLHSVLGSAPAAASVLPVFSGVASNFSKAGYEAAVAEAIRLIREGAIFQANLAQHLSVKSDEPLSAYALFRKIAGGGAPYAAFLQFKEGAIISNSPERFFRIEKGRIVAEPVKGTRARSKDEAEDRAAAAALLADPKERAENIMIADLARNDLSRISKDGSIREEAICALESHEGLHHLVSRISGALKDGVGAVDAFESLFPCGSVTGAPKVEAMKTIAALEGVGRGPYCGAIGYIDDRGAADFSVAIRIMIVEAGREGARLTFPVGGGVTLRSDPRGEYNETLLKAQTILKALGVEAP
ncbi:MAG: anthranilate synthase component I family protein [Amphiplicatus sp.]